MQKSPTARAKRIPKRLRFEFMSLCGVVERGRAGEERVAALPASACSLGLRCYLVEQLKEDERGHPGRVDVAIAADAGM